LGVCAVRKIVHIARGTFVNYGTCILFATAVTKTLSAVGKLVVSEYLYSTTKELTHKQYWDC